MTRPLTDKEKFDYHFITNPESNTGLIQVEFAGEETAAICAVNEDGDEYDIIPLAILITEEMFKKIKNPTED